jgi:hypothetical protein
LTNFCAQECENLRSFRNTQWQWGPFELLLCLIEYFMITGEICAFECYDFHPDRQPLF